jgi:GDP-L-fucose synthase
MKFEDKRIVVTGANGLVGIPTVRKCLEEGAKEVLAVDIKFDDTLYFLKEKYPENLKLVNKDLTSLQNCEGLFLKKVDIVLHIAGIKGSPARTALNPADYLFPMLMFNTNMIKSSFDAKVGWFVYLSSVGVYAPADIMEEDSVWKTMPSKNDWHPGWTKRMGELALDALRIQHNWTNWTVIRPSNIYGINDKFTQDATVIGANIWKLFNQPGKEIECWGDGSPRRDFVFGDDVAQAAIDVVKKEVNDVINFGCGEAVSIKYTIELIVDAYKELTGKEKTIVWDTTKPTGDMLRCLSSKKQEQYGILPKTSLKEGILKTVSSYFEEYKLTVPTDFSSLHKDGFYVGHINEIVRTERHEFEDAIKIIKQLATNERENYFNYRYSIVGESEYPDLIKISEIEKRKQQVEENNLGVIQKWYEMLSVIEIPTLYPYFVKLIESFISKPYPEIDIDKKNMYCHASFALYEDGDFIEEHRDGDNPGRLCAVFIYLSDSKDYNDGGGKLIITKNDGTKIEILPVRGNYVILDFTTHNLIHKVEPVKNGFKRYSYLGFIYNTEKDTYSRKNDE